MKCLIKNCLHETDQGVSGRTICVEPDDDGWICESCWQFLTTGVGTNSAAYLLAGSAEYNETLAPQEENDLTTIEAMEVEDEEFVQMLEAMEVEDEEFDAIQDHMASHGVSRLSYGDLVRSKGMDKVREQRLEFNNFTLDEKVALGTNGVLIWQGDTYERDACRCEDFSCSERWRVAHRSFGWQVSRDYQNYIDTICDHIERLKEQERNRLRASIIYGA